MSELSEISGRMRNIRNASALHISIVTSIFMGNGISRNCYYYRAVNLFVFGMKVVGTVLEKRLCEVMTANEMQFVFLITCFTHQD